ncbi:hypothetical protein LOZ63_000688 [Ophidiomyces ophidiicola]|nr:hypothetical protein LOZ63_000688 [Ophidiomyces ophidiicola]
MAFFAHISHFTFIFQNAWITLFFLLLSYVFTLSVYRLYFHPLAKFPGPKLAALTLWYEYYYDGIKTGQYTFEIERMHQKYGPIVRISPYELHVNDPKFLDVLYTGPGARRDKYEYYSGQFGQPNSAFGTSKHDLHRVRRSALNQFFSKFSIRQLEPTLSQKILFFCDLLDKHTDSGKPVNLSNAYSCITSDVAIDYAFGRGPNFVSFENPDFERTFRPAILSITKMGVHFKHFGWARSALEFIPVPLLARFHQGMAEFMKFQKDIAIQVRHILDGSNKGHEQGGKTIFHALLTSRLPPEEKTQDRLFQEGIVIVGAGTETTAWALSVGTFYLLSNPEVLAKLRQELEDAIPDPAKLPSLAVLENLPAVVMESLRLSYGVSTRSQRISPDQPLIFKSSLEPSSKAGCVEYEIPAGTPVGMTCYLIHNNTDIFPEPKRFIPERWLDHEGKRHRHLDPFIMAFSKGTRQCLGINLAYAEMYMSLAAVMRVFGGRFQLFETTLKDVEMKADLFVPAPQGESTGVQVLVRAD